MGLGLGLVAVARAVHDRLHGARRAAECASVHLDRDVRHERLVATRVVVACHRLRRPHLTLTPTLTLTLTRCARVTP